MYISLHYLDKVTVFKVGVWMFVVIRSTAPGPTGKYKRTQSKKGYSVQYSCITAMDVGS